MSEMTRTEELLALAEKATPGPWVVEEGSLVNRECDDDDKWCIAEIYHNDNIGFIAAANPETIKQLVELCRLQHEALMLLDYGTRFDEATGAIAAFNKFEGGE